MIKLKGYLNAKTINVFAPDKILSLKTKLHKIKIKRLSKFLEIQTAVKFENVQNTKILFLFMFYYHF